MAKTTITTDHTVLFVVEGFLSQVFTEKAPQEIITVLQKNHGINEKALYLEKGDVIQDMTQLTALFRKEKKELVDKASFYFASPSKGSSTERLLSMVNVAEASEQLTFRDVKALEDFLLELPYEDYQSRYATALYSFDNTIIKGTPEVPQEMDTSKIIDFICHSSFPDEVKLKLQQVYLDREEHVKALCSIYQETLDFLSLHEDKWKPHCDRVAEYWTKKQGKDTFYEFICKNFQVIAQMKEHPGGYLLIPSPYLMHFSMSVPDGEESSSKKAVLLIGLLYGEVLQLNELVSTPKDQLSTEPVVNAMKLLSDSSKFSIMQYLKKNGEAYGIEIAEHLGLTTATVSHHLGLLLEADLIQMVQSEQKDRKIYYRINETTLQKYLDYYEAMLL